MTLDRVIRFYHILGWLEDLKIRQGLSKTVIQDRLEDAGYPAKERTLDRDLADLKIYFGVLSQHNGVEWVYRLPAEDEDVSLATEIRPVMERLIASQAEVQDEQPEANAEWNLDLEAAPMDTWCLLTIMSPDGPCVHVARRQVSEDIIFWFDNLGYWIEEPIAWKPVSAPFLEESEVADA